MSNDLTNNKADGQPSFVTDQACKAFEESSVCAVSTILTNDNKHRKIFRSVVFLLFAVVFLYQCIAFLCYVLQYPTVVDFEVSLDETFVAPAYTFCILNPVKRSKFCSKYPRNCTKPDRRFCDEHPRFCGTPDTLIPKEEDFNIDSVDEYFLLNHEAEDIADFDEEYKPNGPLPRVNGMETLLGACFTFNDRINSPLDPLMKSRNPLGNGMYEMSRFDSKENEAMYIESETGMMFQVHSPFEPVNPFETGYFMRPGYLYRIIVKMTHEELLPYECTNYTDVWLKNNKSGYRSQLACKHKCMGDVIAKCINCTEPIVLYPYPNTSFCEYREDNMRFLGMCEHPEDEVVECMNNCKDDCVKMKFSSEVKESYNTRYVRNIEKNESRDIMLRLDFPQADMRKIIHKPQFQVLEIFSLIGGLLAFWIGLSMFQVVEMFDCIFQIVKCLVKKRSVGSESSVA